MNKEKHENSKHSKTHHVQQAGLEETKVLAEQGAFIPQRQPQMQQISRMANIPNPGAHAAILNRTKANQLSSNRQLLLQLQRQYGNSYVQRVMQQMQHSRELVPSASRQQPDVQAKLTIGEPGSEYEREADKVARQVVQQINAPASVESAQSQTVQRQAPDEEELMMKPVVQLQANTQMTAAPDLEASINQARGSGQPLADNIRKPMEQAFGADFSGVKVHTDVRADQLNQSIQAKAFTTGQDVFFRQGEYNPGSRGGQELLAHELTHVVQQRGGGRVLRAPSGLTLGKGKEQVTDDSFTWIQGWWELNQWHQWEDNGKGQEGHFWNQGEWLPADTNRVTTANLSIALNGAIENEEADHVGGQDEIENIAARNEDKPIHTVLDRQYLPSEIFHLADDILRSNDQILTFNEKQLARKQKGPMRLVGLRGQIQGDGWVVKYGDYKPTFISMITIEVLDITIYLLDDGSFQFTVNALHWTPRGE